jgi:hypothetical protein
MRISRYQLRPRRMLVTAGLNCQAHLLVLVTMLWAGWSLTAPGEHFIVAVSTPTGSSVTQGVESLGTGWSASLLGPLLESTRVRTCVDSSNDGRQLWRHPKPYLLTVRCRSLTA